MIDNHINENHIPGIRRPDGSISTQQEDIHNGFHSCYSDLYSHKPTSTTHINKHIPRLPPELIASLSNPITIADVLCVAKNAKKDSAPGPDGIPYSLYERVPILQLLLVKVIQAAIQTGRFPSSWGLSFIRPILKPGKDPLLASSYRPIALLCTDYKIFTSVIAGRFKLYLITIFPNHQSGYITGRSTHHGALRFSHMIKNTPNSFPLLVDSEKAYDRVSHEWLSNCLTISGFPTPLATLLLAIHQDSRVIINNRLSQTFHTSSGVRQGDPLAPILFILSIEPLLKLLEDHGVDNQSHCDDLAIVATPDTLQVILESLATYETSSGARLNTEKSFIITRLPTANSPFPSCRSPRRYLDFHIYASGTLLLPPTLIDECIETLQRIKKLPLSLAGRMAILSSYIRPKLFYRLTVATCSNISDYLLVERWFLSSSSEYHRGQNRLAPFSYSKLSLRLHPNFHSPFNPLQATSLVPQLSPHQQSNPYPTPQAPLERSQLLLSQHCFTSFHTEQLRLTKRYLWTTTVNISPSYQCPLRLHPSTSSRRPSHPNNNPNAFHSPQHKLEPFAPIEPTLSVSSKLSIASNFVLLSSHSFGNYYTRPCTSICTLTAHSAIYRLSTHSTSSQHALSSLHYFLTHLHSQTSYPLHTPKTKHSLPSLHCERFGNSSIRKHMKVLYQTTPEATCSGQSHLTSSAEWSCTLSPMSTNKIY